MPCCALAQNIPNFSVQIYIVLIVNSQTHSNFGKVDEDGGGLVLKMWICMAKYLKK